MKARIGIVGGTGVYDPDVFELEETVRPHTPYGLPSDEIQIGTIKGTRVAFMQRHGKGHIYPPHMVNYRANIWALKQVGVERIISPCAVGSLQEEFEPGEIVIVDQFIDLTKKRDYTFYNGPKTVHISTADPFCPELASIFSREAKKAKIKFHQKGTYVCIEGPRFSTRAESQMYRAFADVIGMTLVPECQLAREMEMCYCSLAMITDYDVWADHPVDTATVLRTMSENVDKIRALISSALPKIPEERKKCACPDTLRAAGA
ncbi:MAG: S-methyl-5'-thioadenosine phosphorylase [Methanomassiliicoccales archaeon]|nr:MAG: S-methyl-5'-thioadenosine phosphorylase [Methanomassiliicoccales archaeon]